MKNGMHYYVEAIKKYMDFEGRASRKAYWMFYLIHMAFVIGIYLLEWILNTNALILLIYGLLIFFPSLSVSVRRLHDIGKSGWWVLITLVPFIGAIILIVFLALRSQPGVNQYGPNPNEIKIA
jgi:uncharacterized membrane protein YhaH (DUF805 family)